MTIVEHASYSTDSMHHNRLRMMLRTSSPQYIHPRRERFVEEAAMFREMFMSGRLKSLINK